MTPCWEMLEMTCCTAEVAVSTILPATTTWDGGADMISCGEWDGGDTLNGGSGDDIVRGGAGNDTIFAGTGADFLDGGEGNDRIYADGSDAHRYDVLFGSAGDDVYILEGNNIVFRADAVDAGYDLIEASTSIRLVNADGSDVGRHRGDHPHGAPARCMRTRTASPTPSVQHSANSLFGRGGSDTLFGNGGSDYLSGGADYDLLIGGTAMTITLSVITTASLENVGEGTDTSRILDQLEPGRQLREPYARRDRNTYGFGNALATS
jgi:Ca2+-binding RTX toxin-like protein